MKHLSTGNKVVILTVTAVIYLTALLIASGDLRINSDGTYQLFHGSRQCISLLQAWGCTP
jgi:hypothetical protein